MSVVRGWPLKWSQMRVVGPLAGTLLLAVATTSGYSTGATFQVARWGSVSPWLTVGVLLAVTVAALSLVRFWPHLIVAAALAAAPGVLREVGVPVDHWGPLDQCAGPLALIGVLAGAQALFRAGRTGWAACVAGTAFGAQLLGAAMLGSTWLLREDSVPYWRAGLATLALGTGALAVVAFPAGDPTIDPGKWNWGRLRLVLAGAVAVAAGLLGGVLSLERVARLLGVSYSALFRHQYAAVGVIALAVLVVGLVAAALTGAWAAAAALAAGTAQVAVAAPMILAVYSVALDVPLRWGSALLGVGLGAVAAATRWRVPLAAAGAGLTAGALYVAFAMTTGAPEKLVAQRQSVPGALLLVAVCATATALVGSTAPVLARRGALPVALGPVVTTLSVGGALLVQVTYVGQNGLPTSSYLNPVHHVTTSATMLLVAAAALIGLVAGETVARRRSERRAAEAIRREAAAAERERLARPIHDGVLQVLALMERRGPELGEEGARLAELAHAQGVSLRSLIATEATVGQDRVDLRGLVAPFTSVATSVAVPADPVTMAAHDARELAAAVAAALANVHQHAGPGARAWVLVEDTPDEVRVSVRDDGAGMPAQRLAEAAAAGRLGVAQSMVGRVRDLGGTTEIVSRPGAGTEVEFRVPRHR